MWPDNENEIIANFISEHHGDNKLIDELMSEYHNIDYPRLLKKLSKRKSLNGIKYLTTEKSLLVDQYRKRLLLFNSSIGNIEIVKYLIERYCFTKDDVISKNDFDRSYFNKSYPVKKSIVCETMDNGQGEVFNFFIDHYEINVDDLDIGCCKYQHLVEAGHLDVIKILVDRFGLTRDYFDGQMEVWSSIEISSHYGRHQLTRYLLDTFDYNVSEIAKIISYLAKDDDKKMIIDIVSSLLIDR